MAFLNGLRWLGFWENMRNFGWVGFIEREQEILLGLVFSGKKFQVKNLSFLGFADEFFLNGLGWLFFWGKYKKFWLGKKYKKLWFDQKI